jgi:hypothetical protein
MAWVAAALCDMAGSLIIMIFCDATGKLIAQRVSATLMVVVFVPEHRVYQPALCG